MPPQKGKYCTPFYDAHTKKEISDREDKKPLAILDYMYNATKGAVDTLDKLVHEYSCSRQTNRWPNKIFFDMLDVGAYNAFVIFMKLQGGMATSARSSRRLHLKEVTQSMCKPHILHRLQAPQLSLKLRGLLVNVLGETSDLPEQHIPQVDHGQSQGRCALCPRRKLVRRRCIECHRFICPDHASYQCFDCA